MAGVMVVDTNYGYLSAVFRGEDDLESTKYDLKPQIGQFGYLEPLIFFLLFYFSMRGGRGGNGRKSGSGGIQM